jgi:hypothetical protein
LKTTTTARTTSRARVEITLEKLWLYEFSNIYWLRTWAIKSVLRPGRNLQQSWLLVHGIFHSARTQCGFWFGLNNRVTLMGRVFIAVPEVNDGYKLIEKKKNRWKYYENSYAEPHLQVVMLSSWPPHHHPKGRILNDGQHFLSTAFIQA